MGDRRFIVLYVASNGDIDSWCRGPFDTKQKAQAYLIENGYKPTEYGDCYRRITRDDVRDALIRDLLDVGE